ncbi:MAG: hypothetical protein ACYS0E_16975, partial [Planctomycetota bacterium]|jgi:hypothetical protein
MGPTYDLVGYTRDEVIINYADRDNPRTFSGEEKMPYEIISMIRKESWVRQVYSSGCSPP